MNQTRRRSKVALGEYIFSRLREIGIQSIFGVPRDFNLNLLDHIYKVKGLKLIEIYNELNAAYAADGYTRTHSLPGVLITTYGVGELSASNGIGGAFAEQIPIISIMGMTSLKMQQQRTMIHYTLDDDWDHESFIPISSPIRTAFAVLKNHETIDAEVDRVILAALTSRRPVYLYVPVEVADYLIDASRLESNLEWSIENCARGSDEDAVVDTIIDKLKKSKNPGILVDGLSQRHGALKETRNFIDTLNIPTYTPPLGKSLISESNANYVGMYSGQISASEVRKSFESHDAVLWIGPFPTVINTGVRTAMHPKQITVELHPKYCSVGEMRWDGLHFLPVLQKLVQRVEQNPFKFSQPNPPVVEPVKATRQVKDSDPFDHAIFWPRVNKFLRPGDYLICEVGTSQFGALELTLLDKVDFISQFYYSSIGFTVPVTLGVLVALREMGQNRRVILFVGDGSLQMTVQEFGTMVRERLTPTIFVVNNNGYTVERLIHSPEQGYNDISQT